MDLSQKPLMASINTIIPEDGKRIEAALSGIGRRLPGIGFFFTSKPSRQL
jgi:hypothetical protein